MLKHLSCFFSVNVFWSICKCFTQKVASTIPDPYVFNNCFTCTAKKKTLLSNFHQTLHRLPILYKHKYLFLHSNWQKWNIFYNIFSRFTQINWSKKYSSDIPQQLSNIFNLSFSTGKFFSVLKKSRVITIYKKTIESWWYKL